MVFSTMRIFMTVHMTGWQFIIFIIVLPGIVEYISERMNRGQAGSLRSSLGKCSTEQELQAAANLLIA